MTDVARQIAERWPFKGALPRRMVVKIGSNILAQSDGLNRARMTSICDSVAALHREGVEIVIVSSGAVAAGRGILGLKKRPTAIPELQAIAAIGQGALMEEYASDFRRHGIVVAQILLNRDDMDDRRRYLNARHALHELLRRKVIPIINENDSVNIEELKFGDNDMLSAMVAAKMEANLLLILSNVPGLLTAKADDPDSRIVPIVERVDDDVYTYIQVGKSSEGTGGMKTKLDAARHAADFGIATVIANGTLPGKIERVARGTFQGTLFLPKTVKKTGASKKHWLATSRPKGALTVDDGARVALVEKGRSLLPVGVKSISGKFGKGDVVEIVDGSGVRLAQGITNYGNAELDQMLSTGSMHGDYAEVLHRDNIVIL